MIKREREKERKQKIAKKMHFKFLIKSHVLQVLSNHNQNVQEKPVSHLERIAEEKKNL